MPSISSTLDLLDINAIDLLILTGLVSLVPLLVSIYLKDEVPSRKLLTLVTALGILWVIFGLVSEDLLEAVTSFERMDSWGHTRTAELIIYDKIPGFWDEFPTGNKAFQVALSWLFTMGVHVPGARAINAFLGFWGGLVVASHLKSFTLHDKKRNLILCAFIFFPSTVFWCSGLLKEALTYFGICLMVSGLFQITNRKSLLSISLILGAAITGIMRPHIAMAWMIPICFVALFTRGKLLYSLLALAAVPVLFYKMQDLAKQDFSSLEATMTYLEAHGEGLKLLGGAVQSGDTIPVISGLLAIFFRPFLWESRSPLMAIAAIEVWTLTSSMLITWFSLMKGEFRVVWRHPAVRAALLVLLIASVLFSYLPNDGLLARQRVQVVPAMFLIFLIPRGIRNHMRYARSPGRRPTPGSVGRMVGKPEPGFPSPAPSYPSERRA